MTIARKVKDLMMRRHLPWSTVMHSRSDTCAQAAREADIPQYCVAKSVVLRDDAGYVVAVVGTDRHLDIHRLGEALGRELGLATEAELRRVFPDCAPGAIPPLGEAYGLPTVWDETLGGKPDVYFEAGDHRTLVHMSGPAFAELMHNARPLRHYIH